MMKQFKLVDMREQYRDLILEAESSAMDYESFLVRLLSVEEEGKRGRRTEKLRREACFEAEKRLEDIDYGFNQSLDRDKITELGRLDFIDAGEHLGSAHNGDFRGLDLDAALRMLALLPELDFRLNVVLDFL